MHSKKSLLFVISIVLLSLLIACENPDENETKSDPTIVGSWLMTNILIKDSPVGDLSMSASAFLGMSGTGALTSTLTFSEDSTASVTTTYESAPDTTEPGFWLQSGDSLIIDGAGIDATVPFVLEANSLTITIILPIDFAQNGTPIDTNVDMTYSSVE